MAGERGVWFAVGTASSFLAIESSFSVLLPTQDLRSIATYRLLSPTVPLCVSHSRSLRGASLFVLPNLFVER